MVIPLRCDRQDDCFCRKAKQIGAAMSSVTGEPAAEKPSGRFNLRTVFAVVAGCAFVAFAAKWLMSLDPDLHPIRLGLLIVPWAVGTFVGIAIAGRRHRSTLAAAMGGGSLAASMT